jgi:hypothetical protein
VAVRRKSSDLSDKKLTTSSGMDKSTTEEVPVTNLLELFPSYKNKTTLLKWYSTSTRKSQTNDDYM